MWFWGCHTTVDVHFQDISLAHCALMGINRLFASGHMMF
jgi:hypothetical protein